ncbi:MAG: hypothetical protein SPI30_02545 [Prevotella sp.]|nr:hypothetical protein [Prevotella sp.]
MYQRLVRVVPMLGTPTTKHRYNVTLYKSKGQESSSRFINKHCIAGQNGKCDLCGLMPDRQLALKERASYLT